MNTGQQEWKKWKKKSRLYMTSLQIWSPTKEWIVRSKQKIAITIYIISKNIIIQFHM